MATSVQVFDAIHPLYASHRLRDQQIAIRILALYRDALAEDEDMLYASLRQLTDFFREHPNRIVPKITLTPDRTLRVRWIQADGSFVAIEFTGKPVVKWLEG